MRLFLSALLVIGIAGHALAGGKESGFANIYQGMRTQPGVRAGAQTAFHPAEEGAVSSEANGSPLISTPVLGARGPQLVPLVAQVSCGHDPGLPGGLTCVVPPPPRVKLSEDRPRRRPRPPSPDEVARVLADRAISLAPKPELRLAPSRRGLTGLPSYFWLAERPEPITARAAAGPFSVVAEARPVQYVWNFGDGTDLATAHPGRRWTPKRQGSVDHLYETKGRYRLTVEVIWEARWRLGTGAWRHLGYFTNSDTRPYRVRSVVSVLIRAR